MVSHPTSTGPPLVVVFGEALFDCYESQEVLGGAPFNVAWNLKSMSLCPLLITAVGDDERGAEVKSAMQDWGLSTRGVQTLPGKPTGVVRVTAPDQGDPQFDIEQGAAWDHIEYGPASEAIGRAKVVLLYFGTLALRSAVSRSTLFKLRGDLQSPTFLDLNLRSPWYDERKLPEVLSGVTYLKVNRRELGVVSRDSLTSRRCCVRAARAVRERYSLRVIVVTLGTDGGFLVDEDGRVHCAKEVTEQFAGDTVGAGDAVSAVCIAGILQGWPLGQTIRQAVDFAGHVCRLSGATSTDRGVYEGILPCSEEASRGKLPPAAVG